MGEHNKTYQTIPRLLGTSAIHSQSNSSHLNGIHLRISDYFIPGWADTRFSYRKNITIDKTQVSGSLTNFPVLIDLYDPDLQNDAQASGNDILFTNAAGHLLDHEIEYYNRVYNSTHAHLVAWVKTNLSNTENTILSMYYGNPTIGNQANLENVWDSHYEGVWHLKASGSGDAGEYSDSSSNNNDGQGGSGTSSYIPTQTDGIIGKAQDFDGTDDYIDCGNDETLNITGNEVTVEAWVQLQEDVPPQWGTGIAGKDDEYYLFQDYDGNRKFTFSVRTSSSVWVSSANNQLNTWYHVVGTYDGVNARLFINGVQVANLPHSGSIASDIGSFAIGLGDQAFDGLIDEVRISDIARTTEWIQTEYENQNDPNFFYSVEQKESSPDYWAFNTFKYRKKITIDAAKVSSDLTNFPVLIDLYDTDLHDSAKVQADGDDLVFTTASGTKLDHEIELFNQTYNTTYAHLVAWVRVPKLSATNDTDLILYYGNKAAVSQENPEGVWNSNYLAVHHLEKSPTGTLSDSTSNNEDLSPQGFMTSEDLVNAQIGQGIDFDDINDGAVSTSTIRINDFTISAWINPDTVIDDYDCVANVGHMEGSWRWVGLNYGKFSIDDGNTYSFGSALSSDTWHHILVTYDGSTVRGYVDGSFENSYSKNWGQITYRFQVGAFAYDASYNLDDHFDGIIDEVRISNIARSLDWINTSYTNQFDPSGFYLVGNEEENSDWWADGSFKNRKNINIDKNKVSSDLSNFPVLLDIADSDLKSGKVQSDADDIMFTDISGSKLDHEIEDFQQNSSQGHLIAWIQVPSLSSTENTNITMYYGNSAINSQENPQGVWNSNYIGVWHLDESNGGTDAIKDSTSNAKHGTDGGSPSFEEIGEIHKAIGFDGSSDYINIPYTNLGTSLTYSFWFRRLGSGDQDPFSYMKTTIRLTDTQIKYWSNTAVGAKNTGWTPNTNWNHLVITQEGTTCSIYLNGIALVDAESCAAIDTTDMNRNYIGRGQYYFEGTLDEVRISDGTITGDWITTEYNNQYNPASFFSISTEEANNYWWTDTSFSQRKDIVIYNDKVSADLSNFPVLIDITDSGLKIGKVQPDADDIMFIYGNSVKLDHEIEFFSQNSSHGHLIAWVNVPTLFNNTDTLISMYYGNNELTSQQNPTAVWSDYMGVWHLSESSGDAQDSTIYEEDGTTTDVTQGVTGPISGAYDFNNIGHVLIEDPVDGHLDFGTESFTYSCWLNLDQDTGDYQLPIYKGGTSAGVPGYCMCTANDGSDLKFAVSGAGSINYIALDTYFDTWVYYVAVVDRDNNLIRGYSNGTQEGTQDISSVGSVNNGYDLEFSEQDREVDGILDEVRICSIDRSANWILTEYNNQHDPANFYSVGSECLSPELEAASFGFVWLDTPNEIDLGSTYSTWVKQDLSDDGIPSTATGVFLAWIETDGADTPTIARGIEDTNDYMDGGNIYNELEDKTWKMQMVKLGTNRSIETWRGEDIDKLYVMGYTIGPDPWYRPVPTDLGALSADSTWHTVTVSGVDEDTTGVILLGQSLSSIDSIVAVRAVGSTDDMTARLWQEYNSGVLFVKIDENDQFEYYVNQSTKFYVIAEVKNSIDWLDTNRDDVSPPSGWTIRDLDSYITVPSPASGVILQFENTDSSDHRNFPREYGQDWTFPDPAYDIGSSSWMMVGSGIGPGNRIEISSERGTPDLYNYIHAVTIYSGESPPIINSFGVDETGTGIGEFWVDIIDYTSPVENVTLKLNETEHNMSFNGSYWIHQQSVDYGGFYTYQISNASNIRGNYIVTPSVEKNHSFTNDKVAPDVLQWVYVSNNNTFQANVTDSWGEIDTVRVNVTTYNMQALMGQYTTYGGTIFAYLNNTLVMVNGVMDFQIIVNDTAGNDFVSSTHQGDVFSNHPPIVENLTLSPAIHWSNCSLTLTYDYYDEDGHSEAGTEIRWYKKNDSLFLLEPTYNDTKVIPASILVVGDQWYVNVTPKDGGVFGEANISAIITILNTPPSVTNVVIFYSGSDAYTTSTLNIDYNYDDHEGDIEDPNKREVEWYRNGTHYPTLDNSTSVSPGNTTKGETWYYRIRVSDGTSCSGWVTSDTTLIHNSLPQAVNLTLPSNPTTMDDLVAAWDMADIDGDPEDRNAVIIYWYKDGENQSAWTNLTTIGAGNTSKGESWRFEIRVFDGENYSALTPLNPPVVILNSVPTVSNVELTPTTPATTDSLTATWDDADADSDTLTYTIRWYIVEVGVQAAHNDLPTIPASATAKNQIWYYNLTVFDGTDYSLEVSSSQVTIQNTPPEVTNLALTATPKTTINLVASWVAADNDTSDTLIFNITWYLDGVLNNSWLTSSNSATLTAGNTTKGDNWSFTVQAYDGEAYSSITSLGYNRTILNTAPVVANLTITSNPTTTDPLVAMFDYSDADVADNTSLIFNITWYRNGQEQSSLANTTSIGSGNTNKSQFWWFTVQAYDGEIFSLKLESVHVQILNTAPDITNLVIAPPSPTTNTDLNASWDDTDADSDSLTYTIRWYIVGVGLQAAYNDLTTVPASATVKSQTWYYNLTAFDGDTYSPEKSSSQIVILNSPPEIDSLEVTTNPTTMNDLIANWNANDNDTIDVLTFNVTWYLNGEVNCSWLTSVPSATLNAGNTTKNQHWNVTVQAYDGEAYSSILFLTSTITILNSKPTVTNPSFNNTIPDEGDDFHITYTFIDVDVGDVEDQGEVIVYWYVNWNYNASFQNQTTIYAANTTATEVWYYIVRVFDGEAYSDNVTSEQGVYIGGGSTNTRPMAIDLTVSPTFPQTHEALIANYTFSDVDEDPEVAYEIHWYRNFGTGFQLQSQYNNLFIVPASATSKGQQWNFTVRVFDGIQWSELNVSTTITIANTNPEVHSAGITSSPKTPDDLVATWTSNDNDSDSLTFIVTWYVNGVENTTFANKTLIEAGNTTKGEKWYFTVQAYDGEGLSSVISLAENVTILNTAPLASNLTLTANPTTLDDLVAAWDYFDIDGDLRDDALARINWFKNGENQTVLANQKIVGATNTSKNQVWWFIVQVFDGENYSGLYESAHIQILNSIPLLRNLEISISNPKTTDELVAQWDDEDNDSDILSYTIKWYRNTVYQPNWDDEITIPASATSKGETWYYILKAFDGSDYSSEETLTPGVLILNTVPVIEDLILTLDPHTTDDLAASWSSSDNDSDILTYIVTWYVNGVKNTTFANKTLIEAGNTTKGEKWYFTVQAYDGEGLSSVISLAENVTILNTAPLASNLTLTANPTTLDDLVAAWDYFDIDGDLRDDALARINWFKNGENQTALANQKIVGATNTSKNQVWWFRVRVFDGENYSLGIYESAHISIQNTKPYNSSALPLPTNPTKANGLVLNLSAIIDALYDPDPSDDLEVVRIRWYKEGVLQSTLNDSLIVPGTRLIKGEVWNYSIVPFDGVDYGTVCVSAEIVILNSRPTIINTYFTEATVTTISDLVISFQTEDADGDNITISGVRWFRYESLSWVHNATYDDYVSLPAMATTKGESWKFELAVSDGTDQSVWREAAKEADIINSQPRIDPYSITLTGGTTTSDPLQVNYMWYDDDPGDSNTQTIITWENSGDYLEDTYNTILPAENTTAGEKWWVTITPYDGEDYGDYVNSKRYGISIIIGNTPPSLTSEDIEINGELNGTEYQGTSFGTVFNLNIHYTASDLDGDQGVPAYGLSIVDGFAVGSEYWWYRNRSGVVTLFSVLNDEITVPFYYTQKGDIWWVQVRPRDFYGDFGTPQNSSQITIGNTAPQIVELHWVRLTYYTTNNLVFDYTFFDYDTKDIQKAVFIRWYRNGTYLPGFDNNSVIASQFTRKGEAWYANISVFDGESYSTWYQLLTVTIRNSAPTATNILLTPFSPNTTQSLIATWTFNDADNDSENRVAVFIQWYRNGIQVDNLSNSQTVPSSLTNREESWYFTVQVTDGYNYSITIYKSNTITIINSAPIAVDLQINDGTEIYTTDALVLTWNSTDFDPLDIEDTSSALILWYLNGIEQSAFTNDTEIPAAYVVKGQQWMVSIRVCDNGGLWSEFLNSSLVVIKNSVPTIVIHGTVHPEFIIEDEALEINSSFYSYTDADGDEDQPVIAWYCNEVLMYQNIWVLLVNATLPGDVWYYTIQPFDGTDFGIERTSPEISIESRPVIHSFVATALPDTEGHYELEINVTDSHNEIKQVEFLLSLNATTRLSPFVITSPKSPDSTLWLLDYTLDAYSYLETPTLVTMTVVTEVTYSITYEIHLIQSFTFTLEDKAPPRVLDAYFEMNDELDPTNLTFYAEVQDFGSGVAEVILSYYFHPSDELNQTGGNGAALLQDDLEWLDVPMTVQMSNETGQFLLYMVTVDFVQATFNLDIIYRLSTEDTAGNRNPAAFDIRDYPERIEAQRFIYQPPGLPEWVLLVAGLAVFVIFVGSIVYVKFIRKPELVGLDKELVLAKISDITEAEVLAALDAHTIGVIVSFFDQRHGPIPIIIVPEILKDNFTKLVDLSDRSFSGTGFADDFDVEIPSSYDFVLSHGIRTSVMSFGFALERPDSRGGQENLTCNIIIHQDLFPLVQSFQNEIKRKVHALHARMDKNPTEKDVIRKEVFTLRKYVSSIVLSYAHIYGTTELIEEES